MHACVKRSRDKDWCVVREAQEKQPTAHFEKADERRQMQLLTSSLDWVKLDNVGVVQMHLLAQAI